MDAATFSVPVAVLIIVLLFCFNILAAWMLFTFVEAPAMRRFARPRRAPSVEERVVG
jgi:peptidoglycan/LPS O-acetylase OafA/YrhL